MPYASDAQRRFMHVRHPKIAARWDAETRKAKKKGTYVKPPERVAKDYDRPQHERRMRNTMGVLGTTAAATGAGAGAIGVAEHFGHDPMGFTHREAAHLKPLGEAARKRVLKPIAALHGKQALALGGTGLAGLALSGGYHHQAKQKAKVVKADRRTQVDTALDVGSAGVGGLAVHHGLRNARSLHEQAAGHATDARAAHHVLAAHKLGALDMPPSEAAFTRGQRKVAARIAAVKGPGAALAATAAGAGGYGLYRLAARTQRHEVGKADRQFSQKRRSVLAAKGNALPGGSFPIPDKDALRRAVHSVGRSKHPQAARALIRRRAKELGGPKPFVSKQFVAGAAVGKAMSRDDRRTLGAAGVTAAGLGGLRAGAELQHRAVTSVPRAAAEVARRTENLQAARHNLANIPKGAQPRPVGGAGGRHKILKPAHAGWVRNLEHGVEQASTAHTAALAHQPGRLKVAGKVKGYGAVVAGGGALATGLLARRANRNRALARAYGPA